MGSYLPLIKKDGGTVQKFGEAAFFFFVIVHYCWRNVGRVPFVVGAEWGGEKLDDFFSPLLLLLMQRRVLHCGGVRLVTYYL